MPKKYRNNIDLRSVVLIKKVPTGFRVKYYASNGEMLVCSEVLTTVANAKKNIRAMRALLTGPHSVVYLGETINM